MARFLDTSAVAKLYHDEIGSTFLEQLLLEPGQNAFISPLGTLEMQSVLAGKLRSGEISPAALDLARRDSEATYERDGSTLLRCA